MRRVCVCAAALLCLSGAAAAAKVEVEVDGIEPGPGSIYVALCQGGLSEAACREGQDAPADAPRRRFVFEGIGPGTYAVAAFQDLNGNRRLDRTPLGLPLEPYAFSGDAGRAGRPDFARAAFALRESGASIRVRLARALPRR